jgi:hypothetical protein
VVVHDLDVGRTCGGPAKAQAILIVDANTVLSDPITLERLQAIAWRYAEIVQTTRNLELSELSTRHGFYARKPSRPTTGRQRFGVRIPERDDHPE